MTSYPPSPGDGDNEQTRSSPPPGSGGSGGYPAPGQPGPGQPGFPPGGGYPPGSYQQGGYGPPGAYPGYQPPQAGQPSYYNQPGHPGAYPAGRGPDAPPPSFFGALFDVNFSRFATPSVIKVLYILIMIVVVLVWLGYVVVAFTAGSPTLALITFVGGGLIALVTITFYRIVLEFFYAVVRMSEDIHNRR